MAPDRMQHPVHLRDRRKARFTGVVRGLGRVDRQHEVEAPTRVGGVVQHHRLEHQRVGQRQLVAVQGHQQGRARGQRDHLALVLVHHQVVVRRERATQAQQHAGHVVLGDVLEGEADHQADHARRPQHGADQRRGSQQVQCQHQAQHHHHRLHQPPHQPFQERVALAAAQPGHRPARQQFSGQHRQVHDRQGDHQQRDRADQPHQFLLRLLQGRPHALGEAGADRDLVGHRADAIHRLRQRAGQVAVGIGQHFATQGDDAGVHRHGDLLQAGMSQQPGGDRGGDARVALLAGAHFRGKVPGLLRRRLLQDFGGLLDDRLGRFRIFGRGLGVGQEGRN